VTQLPDRGVIAVAGEDRVPFLQGLVSNDVTGAVPGRAVWAALLSPQGKWRSDFFILAEGDRLLLDCVGADVPTLVAGLSRFRLRSRATVRDVSDQLSVHSAWDGTPDLPSGAIAAPDPRLPEAGWRILSPGPLPANATPADWDMHRIALGLPDAGDLEADKTVLLEAGFDELNGVSWSKGCYMGQELTARTKYRGLVKRRLVPVTVDGPARPRHPDLARRPGGRHHAQRLRRGGARGAAPGRAALGRARVRGGAARRTGAVLDETAVSGTEALSHNLACRTARPGRTPIRACAHPGARPPQPRA